MSYVSWDKCYYCKEFGFPGIGESIFIDYEDVWKPTCEKHAPMLKNEENKELMNKTTIKSQFEYLTDYDMGTVDLNLSKEERHDMRRKLLWIRDQVFKDAAERALVEKFFALGYLASHVELAE